MVPELFLQETRPVAVTMATIVNWMATFLVGFVFPYILVSLIATVKNLSQYHRMHSHAKSRIAMTSYLCLHF